MDNNVFPIEVFHSEIQRTIQEMNRYYTHNLNASAGFILSTIAYSLNNSYEVEIIKDRVIRPNLWMLYVTPSGGGKSPLFECVLKPIREKENALRQEYNKQYKQFNIYSDELKKGSLKDAEQDVINEWLLENFGCINTPTEPQNLCLFIGKYTGEGMDRVLSENYNNGKAIIIKSDEILSILKSFNQYSRGSDEEDFLKLYNYGSESVKRADSSKDVYISEKNVSLIGCTQSDTIFDVITPARIANGHAFRWLYVVENELEFNKNAFESMLLVKPDYDVMESYNKMIETFLIYYSSPIHRIKLDVNTDCIKFAARWLNDVKKIDLIDRKILLNISAKMEDYLFKIAIALNRSRVYLHNEITKTNTDTHSIEIQDMVNAEKVINYFILNSISVLNRVSNPIDKLFKSDIEKEIYTNLPDVFKSNDFVNIYKLKGIPDRTAKRRLSEYHNGKIIGKNRIGEYYKIIAA